jgi:hypothetical protein
MPSLSIKDVPEEIVAKLKERAARNHRSLQGELMALITEATQVRQTMTVDEIYERMSKLGRSTHNDSLEILRNMRDTRYGD